MKQFSVQLPTDIFFHNTWIKDIEGLYSELLYAINTTLFSYFLPFFYPYITFLMFFLYYVYPSSPWKLSANNHLICHESSSGDSPHMILKNWKVLVIADRWGNNCSPLSNGSTVKVMACLTFYSDFVSGWWVMQGHCTLCQTGQSDVLCTRQVWLLLVLLDP